MAFDESLAARVSDVLRRRRNFVEKKMFGGMGYLLKVNMCVGVWKEYLIVRVGIDAYEKALDRAFVKEFNITGRSMRGWVMVHRKGVADEDDLLEWVERAIKFVRTLPAK